MAPFLRDPSRGKGSGFAGQRAEYGPAGNCKNTTCLAPYWVGILTLAREHTAAEPRQPQECSQRAKSAFMNCLTPSPPVRRNQTDPRSRSMRTTMSKNGQQSRSPAANSSTL
jgi:hypothetical protein